jgi:hypothetical protein
MKDDFELHHFTDKQITVSAQVYEPDWVVPEIRLTLPPLPIIITITL